MDQYEKIIEGYQQRQADLRRQIRLLQSNKIGAGGQKVGPDTAATIQRVVRQIADLERAIARCREKAKTGRPTSRL